MTLIHAGGFLTFLWLVVLMVRMGLSVTLEEFTASVNNPGLIIKSFIGNFLLVPLAVAGFLWIFRIDPVIAAGIMTIMVFAGAPLGPQFSVIARADVPFSVGLMVILTLMSVVVSPALLSVLLPLLSGPASITVHYDLILKTLLILQIVPLASGLLIRYFFPVIAQKMLRPVRIIGTVFMLAACILVALAEYGTFTGFGAWAGAGCMLIFLYTLFVGWITGGREEGKRNTMALTTSVRNAAAAMVIGISNFEGSRALVAILVYAAFSTIGSLVAASLMRVLRVADPLNQGIAEE